MHTSRGKAGRCTTACSPINSSSSPRRWSHAQALGLDGSAFQTCLDSGKYTTKINASLKQGQQAGVTGTPAFFLGYTQAGGAEVKATKFLSGALPFETFKAQIDQLLDTQK